MKFNVETNRTLNEDDLQNITKILEESECPNESLKESFPDDNVTIVEQEHLIVFGDSLDYVYEVFPSSVKFFNN